MSHHTLIKVDGDESKTERVRRRMWCSAEQIVEGGREAGRRWEM